MVALGSVKLETQGFLKSGAEGVQRRRVTAFDPGHCGAGIRGQEPGDFLRRGYGRPMKHDPAQVFCEGDLVLVGESARMARLAPELNLVGRQPVGLQLERLSIFVLT